MFFDIFYELCKTKGVSCKKAAEEMGLSNSITTKWKKTGATPSGETLEKVASYFGVTTDYLLGKNETKKVPAKDGKHSLSDDDIKFALFGGDGEITDAMYQEVKEFAALIKLREDMKKSKE